VSAPPIPTTSTPTSDPSCDGWDPDDGTGVTCAQFAAWTRVANCEEPGGWATYAEGPEFYGSLGIDVQNWATYGSAFNETNATPDEQIVVAEAIESNPPDQDGCGGGW